MAKDDVDTTSRLIQSVFLATLMMIVVGAAIICPVFYFAASFLLPEEGRTAAITLLPFTLASMCVLSLSTVFSASLEGLQKGYLKNQIIVGTTVVYLTLAVLLVSWNGLIGLAWAHLTQSILIGVFCLIRLKAELPIPFIPRRFEKNLLRETWKYGMGLQLISVCVLLLDPITKGLLIRIGGLHTLGIYEVANRMVAQVRNLISSAIQVIVPAISLRSEVRAEAADKLYSSANRIVFYVSVPTFAVLVIMAPFVSKVWLGESQPKFVTFTILLSVGWLINVLAAPSYFGFLGKGLIRWNLLGHVLMVILNAIGGILFGLTAGETGVVFGWVIALSVGSLVSVISYDRQKGGVLAGLLPLENLLVLAASIVSILVVFAINPLTGGEQFLILKTTLSLTIFIALISAPLWIHSGRRQLQNLLNPLMTFKRQ
jgi:O-antigen/teichoic acid export membrane protein